MSYPPEFNAALRDFGNSLANMDVLLRKATATLEESRRKDEAERLRFDLAPADKMRDIMAEINYRLEMGLPHEHLWKELHPAAVQMREQIHRMSAQASGMHLVVVE